MSEEKREIFNKVKINILGKPTEDHFVVELSEGQDSTIYSNPGIFKEILTLSHGKIVEKNKNEEEQKSVEQEGEGGKRALWLIIHPVEEFLNGQKISKQESLPFSQDLLKNNKKLPIIHLSPTSIFIKSLYGAHPLPPLMPRLYQIMDSSIWNYLVPLINITYPDYIEADKNSFYVIERKGQIIKRGTAQWDKLFRKAIISVYNNYEHGLYNLEVSHEYADLNARLAGESYLSGAHASGVAPFIFHSESAIGRLIKKEFNEITNKYGENLIPTIDRIKEQKWRILLVDDKAKAELTPIDKRHTSTTVNGLPWNCKLTIIMNLLDHNLNRYRDFKISYREFGSVSKSDETNHPKTSLLVEYVESLEMAKQAIESNEYDAILLDYLLDSEKGQVHYGYELLDAINVEYEKSQKEERRCKYKLGPHGRLFFIFISAYSSAVYERLLAEGLNRSEKYWHIAVGACPTNTPQLFLYNLLKLMEKQLEDSGVDKLSPRGIFDIVNKIYGSAKGEDIGKPVRYRANKYYQKVLDLHYLYRKMLNDVDFPSDDSGSIFNTKGSVLITNFIKNNVNLGGLLEHLTQLVHLTAFGTVRQGPEMWEEYIYFKTQFNLTQLEKDSNGQGWNAREQFNNLCAAIEEYILDLKSDVK